QIARVITECRNVVFFVLVAPLVTLYAQEYQPEKNGCEKQLYLQPPLAHLCRANRHGNRQTGADQHRCIDCTHDQVKTSAGDGELGKIPPAIDEVCAEHSTEEQDFSPEKPPHAERRSITLLLLVSEMVPQFRT